MRRVANRTPARPLALVRKQPGMPRTSRPTGWPTRTCTRTLVQRRATTHRGRHAHTDTESTAVQVLGPLYP
eukprot:11145227-Alexandrium_andersonii.AAC.1